MFEVCLACGNEFTERLSRNEKERSLSEDTGAGAEFGNKVENNELVLLVGVEFVDLVVVVDVVDVN